MGLHRLHNGNVRGPQAFCRLSANGARSTVDWGIRHGESVLWRTRNGTAPLAQPNFEGTNRFHISDRASIRACSFRLRADLEFRRSQRSLRLAAVSRLQSRASSLWTDEPNDDAGPNQRPLREFAG